MALLEAASWGLPIVTTAVGSIGDHFVDGVSSRLVGPGDVDALAAAMGSLFDPDRRAALASGARAVRDALGVEGYCARLAEVYRTLART